MMLFVRSCPLLLALLPLALPAWAQVTLVQDGAPVASLVTASSPSPQATEAAGILQSYIERMSGARLPIVSEDEYVDGPRVLVGQTRATAALGIEPPSGHTLALNEEGYVLRTVGETLAVAGNEDWAYRGTVFAAYTLLEELGCRWYFPGDYGDVIPSVSTVTVPALDLVERPSFRIRLIWNSGWSPGTAETQEWFTQWCDRNKLNRLPVQIPGDGSITALAPAAQYFESHPHIFALNKQGERVPEMLCMTEPDTVRIAVETIKTAFREDPERISFGFAPPDGFPVCYCEDCQAEIAGFRGKGYGDPSLSDIWFKFANSIAAEVYEEFPNRWVLTNGYANRVRPPEGVGEFSPNLGIQSAIIATCTLHPIGDPKCWQRMLYKQVMDRWTEALDFVAIYDYDPGNALDNLPHPCLHNLRVDMPYYRDRGVWGFWTEGSQATMVTHLNFWVRAKLMWNAGEDVDALVRDYCRNFYGQAAKPVEEWMWTLENILDETRIQESWGRIMPWRVVLDPVAEQLEQRIARAEELAGTSQTQQRVQVLRWTHDHMMGYAAMEHATARGDFPEAVRCIDRMFALRDKLEAVQPGLLPRDSKLAAGMRSSMTWHRTKYADLARKIDGTEGALVRLLPREWEYKTDPEDVGVLYQWYLPSHGGTAWDRVDTTVFLEAQGYHDDKGWPYSGKHWYRTAFDIPADTAGKPLTLTIGAVYNRNDYNRGIWVWVNGMLMDWEMERHWRLGHHDVRAPIHVDITDIARPGEENTVAVLVHTGPPGRNVRSGMHRRSFLWTPKAEPTPQP